MFYSFENAAFVDDKEAFLDQQDEDEDEVYEEYDEAPGLSEDEERSPRRKIRFSTEPIRVSNIFGDKTVNLAESHKKICLSVSYFT